MNTIASELNAVKPIRVSASYEPRAIKRNRRSKAQIAAIEDGIEEVLTEKHPCTVRHVFYCCVALGLIEKTEAEYKTTIVRLLAKMRREGRIPWGWISDYTRLMRRPTTYSSAEEAINNTAECYRRSLWADQDVHVEVWSEKDAISGLILPVTSSFDVPLMVARGFSSLTFLQAAAEDIANDGKPAFIYHVGDFDPSGMSIGSNIERRLREFAPKADISFERLAVNAQQIVDWDLPTRPAKKSDSRAKSWTSECVEVDAVPTQTLRELVEAAITAHIEPRKWNTVIEIEEQERGWLKALAKAKGAA